MELSERIAREIADTNAVYGDCSDCDEATMCTHAQTAVAAIIDRHLAASQWQPIESALIDLGKNTVVSITGDTDDSATITTPEDALAVIREGLRLGIERNDELNALRLSLAPLTDTEIAEAQRLYTQTTQGEWGSSLVTEHDGSLRKALVGVLGGGRIASLSPIRAEPPTAHGGFRLTLSMYEQQAKNDAEWIAAAHNLWPRLVARVQDAERQRDLAIAHDSQPYPTAETYEKVCAALEAHRASEKLLSDSYLRIRKLVGAWDTNKGGENRFEVTEAKIADLVAQAQGAAELKDIHNCDKCDLCEDHHA